MAQQTELLPFIGGPLDGHVEEVRLGALDHRVAVLSDMARGLDPHLLRGQPRPVEQNIHTYRRRDMWLDPAVFEVRSAVGLRNRLKTRHLVFMAIDSMTDNQALYQLMKRL